MQELPDDERCELLEQMQIEFASEDELNSEEEEKELVEGGPRTRGRARRDVEFQPTNEASDSDAPMDELEPEVLSDPDDKGGDKRKAKAKNKKTQQSRKHRSSIEKADLHADEQAGDTIYIDNLPNDPHQIRAMLREVRKHIVDLEKQFFVEEDSEVEEHETTVLSKPVELEGSTNEVALNTSHIK